MSRFLADVQGNRSSASRQGTVDSGIWSHIRGWNLGVEVQGKVDERDDSDFFDIYVTGGSNGGGSKHFIGRLTNTGWYPDGRES